MDDGLDNILHMPWDHPNPCTLALPPQAPDIDGLNHTNNGVYVQWCERIAWTGAMTIRHAACDAQPPSLLGQELLLGTRLLASDGMLSMPPQFCTAYLPATLPRP